MMKWLGKHLWKVGLQERGGVSKAKEKISLGQYFDRKVAQTTARVQKGGKTFKKDSKGHKKGKENKVAVEEKVGKGEGEVMDTSEGKVGSGEGDDKMDEGEAKGEPSKAERRKVIIVEKRSNKKQRNKEKLQAKNRQCRLNDAVETIPQVKEILVSRDPKDVFTVKTNRGKRHTVSKDNYIQSMVDDIKDTTPTKLWKTRLLSWVWASA